MKEVHKKSIDSAVNQLLLKASSQQIPLAWDRAEVMQPQCGFGRLAICCSECQEGPCRVNPFSDVDQEAICGRNRHDLVVNYILGKATNGALALAKLASFGNGIDRDLLHQLVIVEDELLLPDDAAQRLSIIGLCTNAALEELCQHRKAVCGDFPSAVTEANLGILQADAVNIVFHGHVDLRVVAGIKEASQNTNVPINLVSLCGNEFSGSFNLPVLTNYDSQEMPLLTGAVDLLVIGSQCVMPSFIKLADRQGIPISYSVRLNDVDEYRTAIITAQQGYQRRGCRTTIIPDAKTLVSAGFTVENSRRLFQSLTEKYACEKMKGVVYLGGCGNIAYTHDAQPVKLAAALIKEGYLVITAGCIGTALAKVGMCYPDWNGGEYPLRSILPKDVPPALNLGSCHDAGEFLHIADVLRHGDVPLCAVFPEITHNKVLATAIGFAAVGIDIWMGFEAAFVDNALSEFLDDKLYKKTGARISPLIEVEELLKNLAEAASVR